jgi:hypothetical protein
VTGENAARHVRPVVGRLDQGGGTCARLNFGASSPVLEEMLSRTGTALDQGLLDQGLLDQGEVQV